CQKLTPRRDTPRLVLPPIAPAAPPCIWKVAAGCGESVAARGPMAIGPLARRLAPAPPQATTAGELWDHRRCHARPNSRWSDARTDKAGYRDQAHLWS